MRWRLGAALLLSAVVGCGSSSAPSATRQDQRRTIRYVVAPHPDDELAAWSFVAPDDASHYFVFIVLGRGERSSSCNGGGFQPGTGERAPEPQPFPGPGTAACAAERVDSFHAFLDGMADVQPNLGRVGASTSVVGAVQEGDEAPRRCHDGACVDARSFDVSVGPRSARFVFDLGDGDLTEGEVTWAIQTVRRQRSRLPVQVEGDIVGAAYVNTDDPSFFHYDHHDQQSVAAALWDVDEHVPGPQWNRTWPADARATTSRRVPDALWCAVLCVDPMPIDPEQHPDARRTGVFQRVYGWLAFPGGQYWPAEETPVRSFFSQRQDFWSRY